MRAAVEAKNAALEALKVRNWLMGQAMLRNALEQAELLSTAEKDKVQAEARTKGVSAALGLLDTFKRAAQARLEASWKAMEMRIQQAEEALERRLQQQAQQRALQQAQQLANQPLDSATRSYMAWAKAVEEGKFDAQAYAQGIEQAGLSQVMCPAENTQPAQPKPWWQRAGEWVQQKIVQPVQQAVPKVMNWVDQHQTEIAIGIGIAAGAAAIVLSGGAATPLVAAAWVAGSAAVAGGVVAAGTIGVNAYFHRPLTTNLWRNVGYAAGAAAVTATAGFALQAVAPTVTRAAAQFCLGHVSTCSVAAPAFKTVDYTWTGYDVWQSRRTLNNPRASTDEKLLAAVNIGLATWSESLEPDDTLAIGLPLDDVVRREVLAKFAEILEKEGREAALAYLKRVAGDIPLEKLLGKVDDDVLVYTARSGPDAVKALAGWSDDQLAKHGVELALRAEQDAKAIQATQQLVKLGPIDPAHLRPEQEKLLEEIARNSMQYADNGSVVIGAWKGLDDGYVQYAMETGSAYYHNHPQVWDVLKSELGEEGASQVAWLINQKALQPYIEKGVPFEYTLKGVDDINRENTVVKLIWEGKGEIDILQEVGELKTRWRELLELYRAGYQKSFDDVANTYILVRP